MSEKPEALEFDKAAWGDGPWNNEPDRVEFEHAGLPCLLSRGGGGQWCGYVAVPPSHPLHGKEFDSDGVNVDAHGGLTYSAKCYGHICHVPKPGEPDDVWWFGFDCAHSGDYSPRYDANTWGERYNKPYNHAAAVAANSWGIARYRDLAYARLETERLAEQLAAIPLSPRREFIRRLEGGPDA